MEANTIKIVNVTNPDTGHQSYLLSRAINEFTKHTSLSCVRSTPLGWPSDVLYREQWKQVPDWVCEFWASAAVIHTHHGWIGKNYWCKTRKDAGWVIHQHKRAGAWREILDGRDEEKKAIRVVSTLNLMPFVKWNIDRWFPRPIFTYAKKKPKLDGRLLVCQSPTRTGSKQTEEFVRVMEKLQQHYDVEYEILTGMTHDEVMVRKARADILFDQLYLCYGTSALEAWALGIPAVAGTSDELHDFVLDQFGEAPYVRATDEDQLYDALEQLITDTEFRFRMGDIGWKYVKEFHHPKACAEKAIKTYREAIRLQRGLVV